MPHWKKILLTISVLLLGLAVFVIFLPAYFYFSTRAVISPDPAKLPITESAMILGAAILKNGDLSPVLKDRADAAIDLYQAHKVVKILVTGNDASVDYNEVTPVRKYLIKNDVPSQAIFLDHAGFDTYSSMYRARDVFQVKSMVIVSQSFHLPRAVFIARRLGINAYGLNADNGTYSFSNYFREIPADVKAYFNLILKRHPKFLGEAIPITGTGEETLH